MTKHHRWTSNVARRLFQRGSRTSLFDGSIIWSSETLPHMSQVVLNSLKSRLTSIKKVEHIRRDLANSTLTELESELEAGL